MTNYTINSGDITKGDENVGYVVENIPRYHDCMVAIKKVLESHGHKLFFRMFNKPMESEIYDSFIREVENGYYISGRKDDLNYAYFSKEMNCAKSCAKAVLDVIS